MVELAHAGALPREVAGALGRVCRLVQFDVTGWTVGGEPAGTSAEQLADALYGGWYTQPESPPPTADGDPPLHGRSLTSALRAAHAAAGDLCHGWTVTASDPRGSLVAVAGESSRVLRPGDYRMPLRPGVPPAPGEPVEPVARLDAVDAERGLWWTFTERLPRPPTGRLYLNVRPTTAVRAVHEVTAAVGSSPHQLKCPVLAEGCQRVDAIVVYHERAARTELLEALVERWSTLGGLLDPAVPPLTCRARPGLAWADDVGDGRSYGEHRCHVLATTVIAMSATWAASGPSERLDALAQGLRAGGIDPLRPWQASP